MGVWEFTTESAKLTQPCLCKPTGMTDWDLTSASATHGLEETQNKYLSRLMLGGLAAWVRT